MPPLPAPQDEERIEDQLEHLKELHLQASTMQEIANPPRHLLICGTASTSADGDSAYAGTHGGPSFLSYVPSLVPLITALSFPPSHHLTSSRTPQSLLQVGRRGPKGNHQLPQCLHG